MTDVVDIDLARYERELSENIKEQERQELVWESLDEVLEAILKAKEAGLGTPDKFKWLEKKLNDARFELAAYLRGNDAI